MRTAVTPELLAPDSSGYSARLLQLGQPPPPLQISGNRALLNFPLMACLGSSRCPGAAFLRAVDQAHQWREAGTAIISGFHSPVEREVLAILLAGGSPIVLCPARTLAGFRLRPELQPVFDAGRLLLVSIFTERRPSAALCARRNRLVAGLATEIWVPYATPGGQLERLLMRQAPA